MPNNNITGVGESLRVAIERVGVIRVLVRSINLKAQQGENRQVKQAVDQAEEILLKLKEQLKTLLDVA